MTDHDDMDRQATQEVRDSLKELHWKLDGVVEDVNALKAELGPTLPNLGQREGRLTIQGRLHVLENDSAAAKLATANMQRTEQARAEAVAAERRARDQHWTRLQKIGLFLFAFIGAMGTAVSMLVLLLDRTAS